MTLRGFSSFEKMFRAKMAQTTPINVLTAKKKNDGLTQQEVADYKRVFNKVLKVLIHPSSQLWSEMCSLFSLIKMVEVRLTRTSLVIWSEFLGKILCMGDNIGKIVFDQPESYE